MSTQLTRQIIEELSQLISASSQQPKVTVNDITPLSELTEDLAVDVTLETVVFTLDSNSAGRAGYLRTMLFSVYVAANVGEDNLVLMDIVDSLESSILNDNKIWKYIVDRDIVSVNYDHAEMAPVRGATIVLEVRVKMDPCT